MSFAKIIFAATLLVNGAASAQTTTRPNWKSIQVTNGFGYAIDLNSISRPSYPGEKAVATICMVMNNNCDVSNLIKWEFDCQGHYRAIDGSGKAMIDVPANSVPSSVGKLVCAEAAIAPRAEVPTMGDARMLYYRSQYYLTGLLLRAANVCNGDRRDLEAAFVLLQTDELKTFSAAYSRTTEEWMMRGATNFNSMVMKMGIPAACQSAAQTLREARSISQGDR